MVGPPGREIAIPPTDDKMAETIRRFTAEAAPKAVTSLPVVDGRTVLRTVYPSLVTQQSCADCHNKLQEGREHWKLGDVMGAFAVDVPMTRFLRDNLADSITGGAVLFLLAGGIGFYVSILHYRQMQVRERAEQRLKASEQRFRDFAEVASDWFWEQDADLRFSYLSNAVERSGVPVHDHLGKRRQDVVTLGVTEAQWAAHQADLDARRPFQNFEFQRYAGDDLRHISISGKPFVDEHGVFAGYRGVARDITAETLAEQQLERRVEERTAELHAAQEELLRKERLATLGQLTATVSHELRNPLGVIRNTIFTVNEAANAHGLKLDRAMARIDRSIKRCDLIIADLLDYTRSGELHPETMQVDAWLGDILDEQKLPSGVALVRSLDAPVVALFDPNRLRRAVINLVENAAQALSDPSGREAAAPGACVTVASRVRDDRLVIAVRDNGPGIPPDVLPKIFVPLFSTKGFGVGLGLPTVKQIIEHHDGGIEVNSERGAGAEVTLWIPLRAAKEMAA